MNEENKEKKEGMRHLSLTNTLLLQGIFRKLRVHLSSNNAPNRTIKVFWSSKSSDKSLLSTIH